MHPTSTKLNNSQVVRSRATVTRITQREKQVLNLIAHEHSSKEIAEKLFVSHETVNSHRKNMMDKLGVRNAAGLVRVAFERGLMRVGQVACIIVFLCSGILAQDTFLVTSLSDDLDEGENPISGTFRWAIEQSNNTFEGVDTILFDPSFSITDTVVVKNYDIANLMLNVSRPVVIEGGGVVIFAGVPGLLIQITQEAWISNLRFVNARTEEVGGAMLCNSFGGPIQLVDCAFENNQSNAPENQGRGGAILQVRGETIIANCHFENNTGNLGLGGAISTEGFHEKGDPNFKITIESSTFVNNGNEGAVFIGCHTDLFLLDGDSEVVVLTQGCENFGLQSGSINMETTFVVPFTVPFTIDLFNPN